MSIWICKVYAFATWWRLPAIAALQFRLNVSMQRETVCCSVLQRVAVRSNVLQRAAVCCSVLHLNVCMQHETVCCSVLQRVAAWCSVLHLNAYMQCEAVFLKYVAMLQCLTVRCTSIHTCQAKHYVSVCYRLLHFHVFAPKPPSPCLANLTIFQLYKVLFRCYCQSDFPYCTV